jgi:DNA-directed RNA polymerase specialized sigma24 family protein
MLTLVTDARSWSAQRHLSAYHPPDGHARCLPREELERLSPDPRQVVLYIDSNRVQVDGDELRGPIPRDAVVEAAPNRPRTPADHTLHGVLTDLQLGQGGPRVTRALGDRLAGELPAIRSWVRRELRWFPEAEVEEVAQDVIAVALEKLPGYVPRSRYRAHLKLIARNLAANYRRKRRDALVEDGLFDPPEPGPDALRELEDRRRRERIEAIARAALDPLEQEIVQLRYVLDHPASSLPDLLPGQVPRDPDRLRVLLYKLRRRLKAALERTDPDLIR